MAVTPPSKDSSGQALQATVTALTTQISNTPTSAVALLANLNIALNQAQVALVMHYLEIGRITAATILSTLS